MTLSTRQRRNGFVLTVPQLSVESAFHTSSCNSPRGSVLARQPSMVGELRESIDSLLEGYTTTVMKSLNVPEVMPTDALGPSREFIEKHNLTLINNLMGFSCLFFLVTPLTILVQMSNLQEQSSATILVAGYMFISWMIQTILSISGDYWFTRRAPESSYFCYLRALRWLQGKREQLVVTGPDYIEQWKMLFISSKLDVFGAKTQFVTTFLIGLWQLTHGATIIYLVALFAAIAVVCQKAGGTCWKGNTTYCARKIWWYNFFHFNWHLFGNIALYTITYDLCQNGLRSA